MKETEMELRNNQPLNVFITHVEKEGPFLKLWGQTDKSTSSYVEQFLITAAPQLDVGLGEMNADSLHSGTLICAKYKEKYYRAKVTDTALLHSGLVQVNFLDYGNTDVIPFSNIRNLESLPTSLISIPRQAAGFILAETHCVGGGEWNDTIFDSIATDLKFRAVQCTPLAQATEYFLVKLFVNGNDLGSLLVTRGLMQPISLQAQQAVLLSMRMQKQQQQHHPPMQHQPQNVQQSVNGSPSGGLNTYKACTLEPGCVYPVCVSYVNSGPCHFFVQLKQSEEALNSLMSEINSMTLRPLDDIPIPGTICLARCQEDGYTCRAVVTNEVDNQFKVFYVDFGNYEVVPLDAIYQIPFKYVIPKVKAIRFALAGIDQSTVTMEMRCAFKKFVDDKSLHMKVLPTPRMTIPQCELWDPETKVNALDVVTRAALHAYPEPFALNRGFTQPVKISYVYSCNRFYIQLVSKEDELASLMANLQQTCVENDYMDPASIKEGLPCSALFETDSQWYRAQVVEATGPDSAKVRYIDYGNEEVVSVTQLKVIEGEQLTVLRPQAIECCLNGYQNMTEDAERDSLLEELILEGKFTMKVVEMLNKKALVELFDQSNYNVASLLLDRLAAAKSQVSPVLVVQAGNKIEHRKSSNADDTAHLRGGGEFRSDRRTGRDNTRNFNKTNDRNERPWRENRDTRNFDNNSNENSSERLSWRENNKGFSPRHTAAKNHEQQNGTDNWNAKATPSVDDTASVDTWNDTTAAAWESSPPQQKTSNWERPSKGGGRFESNNRDGFAKPYDRSERGGYRSDRGDGGFKKKPGFNRRDGGGDLSSSESEKSFQRGPRTSSRNDRRGGGDRGGYRRNDRGFGEGKPYHGRQQVKSPVVEDSWNVSAVTSTGDAAPVTATFKTYELVGTESNVQISWFHSPEHFYCQLMDHQSQFKTLMNDIQQFYKRRNAGSSVVGAPVIGLFPEDNILYRAQVLEVIGSQYKVFYVDFGNVSTITKVWPIEKRFMELPAQAIVCSLHGIKPSSDKWLDSDRYAPYFDKNIYICKFVEKNDVKTSVNLTYNNEDIAQLLVRDGLAASLEAEGPLTIDLTVLLGQQFRATVKSINNPSDIIIALQCELAVNCTLHNLETATETFEDVLKGLLEQTVIVYVDNVIDDKLEVTLYDTEGTKYVVLNPDEGAYDTVDAICPILLISSNITGYVSHAEEGSVFIQPTEYSNCVTILLDQLFEHYENLKEENTIIPEIEQVYAVHSEDGNWYRGKVLEFDDDNVTVQYIDYGNTEKVGFTQLRELDPKFKKMCALCVQVSTTADTTTLVDKDVSASLFFGDNGWEGTVTPTETAPSSDATVTADDTGFVTSSNQGNAETLIADTGVTAETAPAELRVRKGIEVFVSHVDTPGEFYVQLKESLGDIEQLQAELQEEVQTAADLETPAAGVLCAAPYSIDHEWYRAEVLDADDDITTVRFVDFGYTDVIDNNTTKLKSLSSNLLSLALYATRCSLNLQPLDDEWSSAVTERLEMLIMTDDVTAEFLDQDEKTNYIEMYSNGESIKDILIKENLALPRCQTTEAKVTGFVSHLNSPSEFWIQLENCVDELEWIAEQLSTAETFPELEDLSPGSLCAALFPDDMMWYRARVLSNTVAGVELLFIDYGNSCASTDSALRKLPEELSVTPPLAQKCALKKPEGMHHWSKKMCAKFAEISADGQTIFTVKKLSTGETSIVQLLLEDKDIVEMLLPQTEAGHVKEIESLYSFRIEKQNGGKLPDVYRLEEVNGTEWNEEATEKFRQLNKEGATLFQIEFLPDNTVCLYVNGNDIRYEITPPKSPVKTPQKVPKQESAENITEEEGIEDNASKSLHEEGSNEEVLNVENVKEANDTKEENKEDLDQDPKEFDQDVNTNKVDVDSSKDENADQCQFKDQVSKETDTNNIEAKIENKELNEDATDLHRIDTANVEATNSGLNNKDIVEDEMNNVEVLNTVPAETGTDKLKEKNRQEPDKKSTEELSELNKEGTKLSQKSPPKDFLGNIDVSFNDQYGTDIVVDQVQPSKEQIDCFDLSDKSEPDILSEGNIEKTGRPPSRSTRKPETSMNESETEVNLCGSIVEQPEKVVDQAIKTIIVNVTVLTQSKKYNVYDGKILSTSQTPVPEDNLEKDHATVATDELLKEIGTRTKAVQTEVQHATASINIGEFNYSKDHTKHADGISVSETENIERASSDMTDSPNAQMEREGKTKTQKSHDEEVQLGVSSRSEMLIDAVVTKESYVLSNSEESVPTLNVQIEENPDELLKKDILTDTLINTPSSRSSVISFDEKIPPGYLLKFENAQDVD